LNESTHVRSHLVDVFVVQEIDSMPDVPEDRVSNRTNGCSADSLDIEIIDDHTIVVRRHAHPHSDASSAVHIVPTNLVQAAPLRTLLTRILAIHGFIAILLFLDFVN